jgi:hypothetical protein
MKLYGSLSQLVAAIFRKDSSNITLRPNQTVTYGADRDVQLPEVDASVVLTASGYIDNDDIAAGAAIVDTKLATISTAGKVSGGAITSGTIAGSTSLNTSGTVTASSLSGPLTGNVTGNVSGTADNITATSNSTLTTLSSLSLPGSQVSGNISGNAANVTGTVAIANGGTGATTAAAALTALAGTQASGQYLRSNGTNTLLSTIQAGDVPTLNQNTTGTAANVTGIVATANGGSGQTTANAALNAFLPSQSTSANKYLKTDGTNTSWASASGGAGEINAILNSSGADGITGWVAGTSHTTPTVITGVNNPLDPIVSTAFSFTASAGTAVASSGQEGIGIYDDITLPTALQNRKLKIEFSYSTPASSAGTWAVVLYQGSTKVSLSTNTGATPDTVLPAGVTGGKFTAYFDSINASAYRLLLVQRTRTLANNLYLTNIIVGPGIQPQGAVVGEWTSFTPATPASTVSYSALTGRYRRVGDSAQIRISGTINAGSSFTYLFNMPTSIGTIDTTKVRNGNYQDQYGVATYYRSPTINYIGVVQKTNVANQVRIVGPTGGNEWSQGTNVPVATTTGDGIELEFTVPIAEWAGSGTVQLAQNDVEYAWNSDPGTAAGTTYSNSTYYGYGPNGTPILSINSTTTTSESKTVYRVQFQTPAQAGDQVIVELNDGNGWFNAAQRLPPVTNNASAYGITIIAINATTYGVAFGNAGLNTATAATYSAAGSPWSGVSAWRWRVRKSSAGAAVGFGLADTQSAGLVNPYTVGSGVIYAGTYTPTVSGAVNITGSPTVRSHNYMRTGSMVFVTGSLTATITTTSTDTSFNLSLPVPTANFASAYDGHGTLVITNSANNAKDAGVIFMNSGAQTASFSVENVTVGTGVSGTINYSFSYKIN